MSQSSIWWTTGVTGDGTSAYTQDQIITWRRAQMLSDTTDQGVYRNYAQTLLVSGVASPVNVGTGAACVYGFDYFNSSNVTVSVSTPSTGTRLDRVVLRADDTLNTVRIAHLIGTTFGGGGTPGLTQNWSTGTWEIPLATLSITTGGVITVTSERVWLSPNINVVTNMINADAVTTTKIANDAVAYGKIAAASVETGSYTPQSIATADIANSAVTTAKIATDAVDDTQVGNRVAQFYRRQGGSNTNWVTAGTATRTPTTVRAQWGVINIASGQSTVAVSYPTAFSGTAMVLISPVATDVIRNSRTGSESASGFTITLNASVSAGSAVNFSWLALGPE